MHAYAYVCVAALGPALLPLLSVGCAPAEAAWLARPHSASDGRYRDHSVPGSLGLGTFILTSCAITFFYFDDVPCAIPPRVCPVCCAAEQGFGLPFDRHDWVVDRCGQEVRYVIDFYNGGAPPGAPPAFFLDVRPALDSFGAAYDRVRMQAKWVFSGRWITGV